jgi:hypothetical protein
MNDAATFTQSGGTITARANKVTAVAVTPTGSPGYLATGLNSKPTADYNGTTTYFLGNEAAVVAPAVDLLAVSVFAVAQFNVVNRLDALVGWGNSGVADNRTLWFGKTTSGGGRLVAACINNAGTAIAIAGATVPTTTPHVFTFVVASGTVAGWTDNAVDISSAAFSPGTLTANQFALAARPDSVPDRIADEQLSEELVYNRAVTTAERNYIHNNYLKPKWGTP